VKVRYFSPDKKYPVSVRKDKIFFINQRLFEAKPAHLFNWKRMRPEKFRFMVRLF